MRSILVSALAITVVLSGCGSNDGNGSAKTDAGGTGALGSDFGARIGEAAGGALKDLAADYSKQADEQKSQVEALKTSAASYGDDKLNGYISQLDTTLAALSKKLGEIENADEGSMAALQQELKRLIGQSGNLIEQAKARLSQLQGGG